MIDMRIGEISNQTGVSQRMIRHFESLGLLSPKRSGSYRVYTNRESALILKIKELQALWLSLKEIRVVIEEPKKGLENNLLQAFSRNKRQIQEFECKNVSILKSLQSLTLNSSLEKLLQEGLVMEFVKSFEEKNIIRGNMPYLEVLYETYVHLSVEHWESNHLKILHSTDLMHINEGITEGHSRDLKILVSSEEQQFRNAFVFLLSPELIKKITGKDISISNLENEKEHNLQITKWVGDAIKTFNHAWNATFTKIELKNLGMIKENEELKKIYHDDEIIIITNMYTEGEKERFSIGLPYRFVSIVYNLLKR
ncbi:MAG: MerR family transcriptional regulator [Bacteriovoracaceae bacterium]|nr:MerR family transcriptional regulator [Bacteriovoracaceae bacterium]